MSNNDEFSNEDFLALAGEWESNKEDFNPINEAVLDDDGAENEALALMDFVDVDIDDINFEWADEADREKEMMYYDNY